MRKFSTMIAGGTMLLLSVMVVTAQQPGGGKGGGGFGGMFGGGGKKSLLELVRNADVKKALDITDEQLAKIDPAIAKAIAGILNEKQMKRLKEIDLQVRSTSAFTDPEVAKALGLSDDQVSSIKTISDDTRKEMAELTKGMFGGGKGGKGGFDLEKMKENQEKITNLNKESKDKIMDVLSADQRRNYKAMLGEEFKFSTPNFGGFGGGGGKGKAKEDK
jgi:hypothetical protein